MQKLSIQPQPVIGLDTRNCASQSPHFLVDSHSKGEKFLVQLILELRLELREFLCKHEFLLIDVISLDLLSDKDELVRVRAISQPAEKRILQMADREHLLLVASLLPIVLNPCEGVAYNRDKQVEEHD